MEELFCGKRPPLVIGYSRPSLIASALHPGAQSWFARTSGDSQAHETSNFLQETNHLQELSFYNSFFCYLTVLLLIKLWKKIFLNMINNTPALCFSSLSSVTYLELNREIQSSGARLCSA